MIISVTCGNNYAVNLSDKAVIAVRNVNSIGRAKLFRRRSVLAENAYDLNIRLYLCFFLSSDHVIKEGVCV